MSDFKLVSRLRDVVHAVVEPLARVNATPQQHLETLVRQLSTMLSATRPDLGASRELARKVQPVFQAA